MITEVNDKKSNTHIKINSKFHHTDCGDRTENLRSVNKFLISLNAFF